MIGGMNYSPCRTILALENPGEMSFTSLAETLKEYFESLRVVILKDIHFHEWSQAINESLYEYVTKL